MKIKVTEKRDKEMRFLLSDVNTAFANALRRAVLSEVPTMAIDSLVVYDNESFIYDEILSRRMGLIPLTTDLKTYNFMEGCSCKGKGCSKCTAVLTLEAKGPKVVYTKDIQTKDSAIKPVYDSMPLIKLGEGHKIKLEMTAKLGRARDGGARFQAGLASYKKTKEGFQFFVESFNNLTPKQLVSEALSQIETQLEEFEKKLSAK